MIKSKVLLAFSLFFVVIIIYSLPMILNDDSYRVLISKLNVYISYPALILSTILSVKNIYTIRKTRNRKVILLVLSLIPPVFTIYIIINMILVMV